jgi:hypothetical protein
MSSSMSRNERRRNKRHHSERVMEVCLEDPRVSDEARKMARMLLSIFAKECGFEHDHELEIELYEHGFLKIELDLLNKGEGNFRVLPCLPEDAPQLHGAVAFETGVLS